MKIKSVLEYKLSGKRNNRPRKPLVFGDKVFVIFVYEKSLFPISSLQCLNAADFSLVWEYTHEDVINNLVLTANRTLLASCMDGVVVNFNIHDGTVIWKHTSTEGNIGPVSNEVNSKVIFSGIQGNDMTCCIDTIKGAEIWCVKNSGHSYHPCIYHDKILNSIGNDLYCLDLDSGNTLWKVSEPRTYLFNPKVVDNFVLTPGHGLINCYDLETGKRLASVQTGQPINGGESSIREIVADGSSFYFGDERGFFYAYPLPNQGNNNINMKWKIETKGGIESIPAFYQNNILVINNGKQFLSIVKDSGAITQELKTKGEAFISGVTVHEESIYYSCYGGYVMKCGV